MQLKNKVAIVTGSGQGIGLGIALALAKEGCKVVITDMNPKTCEKASEKFKKMGYECISVCCNVSKVEDVENLISKTIDKYGKLDILVNNAGIFPFISFEKMTIDDWDKVMNVNLKGTFLCTKEAVTVMKKGSKIVNISSIASMVGFEGLVHYCASKSGVNGFTKSLALELAPKGINVNAVAPGAIETPGAKMDENTKQNTVKNIPLSRIGSPVDIANAVTFLVSDKSDYITGQVLVVDGGWTLR